MRTFGRAATMSANDPKRTSAFWLLAAAGRASCALTPAQPLSRVAKDRYNFNRSLPKRRGSIATTRKRPRNNQGDERVLHVVETGSVLVCFDARPDGRTGRCKTGLCTSK